MFCDEFCYYAAVIFGGAMPKVSRSALVMHSAENIYQLINDVESYPLFLPDCAGSKILSTDGQTMKASLLVAKGGVKKWFTTENTLIKNEQIQLTLIDGPFKHLTGQWSLSALSDDACKINLDLDYEFSNKLLALAFGRVFNGLANSLMQAFIERAKVVYATP